jgi:hypothetical protein
MLHSLSRSYPLTYARLVYHNACWQIGLSCYVQHCMFVSFGLVVCLSVVADVALLSV